MVRSEEPIVTATIDYERWLKKHVAVVETDLQLKHKEMAASLFAFMRATFYRWASLWPEVCADLTKTPRVLGVGIFMWRISELGAMPRVDWSGASMISMKSPVCRMPLISPG